VDPKAARAAKRTAVAEFVEPYLRAGVGIVQSPCPEQHAWGGVLKRHLLHRGLDRRGLQVPMREHDLLGELQIATTDSAAVR
jgi:hypothetical protein